MSDEPKNQDYTARQKFGILVFVVLCGIPALEMNGFGFGIPFERSTALGCAAIGGALGGWLMCPRPLVAGVIGGFIAGTVGLLAVGLYTEHREKVLNWELVLVQGIASLPGLGIGLLLKKLVRSGEPEIVPRPDSIETGNEPEDQR